MDKKTDKRKNLRKEREKLEQALVALKKEELALEHAEDDSRAQALLDQAKQVLPFLDHSRGCNDEDLAFGTSTGRYGAPDCTRCYVLTVLEHGWCPSLSDFSVEVTIKERC